MKIEMKDIVADKILSYLVTNNIYRKDNDIISFNIQNNDKVVKIYYHKNLFFIDSKYYNGQPHIIRHWNLNGDKNKFGLCLTMDGNDRRENTLNVIGKIKRVKEIVFELWDDPIAERFRELNVYLQTKRNDLFYLSFDEKVKIKTKIFGTKWKLKEDDITNDVDFITINYSGELKNDILNNNKIINSNKKFKLIKIKYKKHIKKIFLYENNKMFKINDFSTSAFWERTNMKTNQKNIKIIGLGSIGGLVLDYFCKSGYDNLEIYDDDLMEVANNPRHILGIPASKIGTSKVEHLSKHYLDLFPMHKISAKNEKFDYFKNEILNNDLIFDTTGGSISKMKEDFYELCDKNKNKNFTYINIFTEPFALGVHCIVINYKKEKPDKKFIEKLDLDERYMVTNKKDFRINFDGCFTPSLPYGFAPLQISVPLFLSKIIKNDFETNHYTIPFLSIILHNKADINEKMSSKISPNEVKLKIWKK